MQELRSEYCKVCKIKEGAVYDVCAYCSVETGVGPFGVRIPGSSVEVRDWMVQKRLRDQTNTLGALIKRRIQAAVSELCEARMDLELLRELVEYEQSKRIDQALSALKVAYTFATEVVQRLSAND